MPKPGKSGFAPLQNSRRYERGRLKKNLNDPRNDSFSLGSRPLSRESIRFNLSGYWH